MRVALAESFACAAIATKVVIRQPNWVQLPFVPSLLIGSVGCGQFTYRVRVYLQVPRSFAQRTLMYALWPPVVPIVFPTIWFPMVRTCTNRVQTMGNKADRQSFTPHNTPHFASLFCVVGITKRVQVKQARVGVAVHIRLGGALENSGDEHEDGRGAGGQSNTLPGGQTGGSYAVWAVTTGLDAQGEVRVGCSENEQTEVPRSAIQRVSVRK